MKSVEFVKSSGPMQGAYAFTTVPTTVKEGSMRAFYNNNVTMFVGGGYFGDPKDIGDPTKVYLTKKSGDPVKYDFALYDEIDISTFNVQSSNNAFIKVKGFLEKTPSGENAIGYELEIVDNTKVQAAEILVSFKDTKGTQYNYYGGITCVGKPAPAGECVVSNVTEFKSAYNRLTSGKIIMKAGTYSMDLLHNKNISIVAEKGATVIINGENETNTNAIITLGLSNSAPISGIIIDGRNKKRDGIDPNGFNGYAMGVTVQDCKVGLRQTTFSWALIISDAVFKNNTTAIDAMAGRIDIRTSTFENNGVAINYAAPNPNECRTHLNKFVNNTTDFYVNTDCNNIVSTQNYFQGQSAVRKPVIQTASGKTAKVYYSPYYTNSEMTTLSADIAGAKTEGKRAITKSLTIPVDRTLNSASVFDSNIFKEMKQTGNEGTEISIPVTELTDVANKKTKITTIWGFNNEAGNLAETLPQTMNLEVKNTLSPAAQNIIDKNIANKGEIVQYVNFTHDGSLPGYATVKVLKTNSITKQNLKLYHINEITGKVEQAKIVDVKEQTINGEVYYIVTVDHCSEYIIATANVFTVDDSSGSNSGSTTPDNSTQDTPAPAPAPTAKPTIAKTQPTANDLTSAVEIENKFKNSSAAEVEINVTEKALLSPKAFEILSENPDKELVLKGDGYSWSFSGDTITDPNAINDTSFDTTISFESPNKDEIQNLTGDADVINIYFNYHGDLPGPATIQLNVGKENAGKTKHLYYYNDTTNSLEYLGEAVIDENGNIEFTITHCSDYLASDTKLMPEDKVTPSKTENTDNKQDLIVQPEANADKAVSVGLIVFVALIVVGLITTIFIVKKKKEKE
ncbi:MAG: hypothetical protein RR162_05650 [Oscillospiraceae bacterium]